MPAEYRVIRVFAGIEVLETCVSAAAAEGWHPTGGPVRDEEKRQWCQAVTRQKPSDVNLKEPGRPKR